MWRNAIAGGGKVAVVLVSPTVARKTKGVKPRTCLCNSTVRTIRRKSYWLCND